MLKKKISLIVGLILICTAISLSVYISKKFFNTKNVETIEVDTIPPQIEYGIVVDSLFVYKEKVQPDENLSIILSRYGIDNVTIDAIIKKGYTASKFNFHKIKAGDNYTVICDSAGKIQYFIYEDSPVSYILCDLRDSIHIHAGSREIKVEIKEAAGIITTSLWDAFIEKNINPVIAIELSDIYAWTIDFYDLQKGDSYKVIYEEVFADDKPIGMGKILGARIYHKKKYFYAVYFVQDSIGDYFDENGQSLRREFLKSPLKFGRVSSKFSYSRLHPILKIRRPHLGVDYAAPQGTPVYAIGDGVVIQANYHRGSGNMVKIKHNATYTTAYLHLWKFAKGIKKGTRVQQGQIIGYVGSTGMSTGPHLDFRFYKNNKPIDPLKVETPPAKPVKLEYLDEFNKKQKEIVDSLNNIKFVIL